MIKTALLCRALEQIPTVSSEEGVAWGVGLYVNPHFSYISRFWWWRRLLSVEPICPVKFW